MTERAIEVQFDGLVGPSHNYAGLSPGNLASDRHRGQVAHPRAAALQGLAKMRLVRSLGVPVAVLPPHERPLLSALRRWGFRGPDHEVIARAWALDGGHLLRVASSASAMWTANAATVAPSTDTADGRVHLVPANLASMPHRSLEVESTVRALRAIFHDPGHFQVHEPLPGSMLMSDEGAANHTRLHTSRGAAHLFAWGRLGTLPDPDAPAVIARQTAAASRALGRLLSVDPAWAFFPRQHPGGIDAGGFHTDVLAVGSGPVLLLHERAFADHEALLGSLREALGPEFVAIVATEAELPVATAIDNYPFNSQLLSLEDGSMVIIAPAEAAENAASRRFFERVTAGPGPIKAVHHVDLRQSMQNGGGPACLRLRVPLTATERQALGARVLVDDALLGELEAWVQRHFRESLAPDDLSDPQLHREAMTALDELSRILKLDSIYEFQHG
jgi:succinylarginine dihydrolase